jgi:sulfoxide reductase heme-binding subunit YedZ
MTLWYLGRAAGIVSLVAFTLAVMLGATASTVGAHASDSEARRRLLQQYAHRAAAVVGLGTLVVHIGSLAVLDSQSGVGLRSVVIPVSSTYRPFAITLGALALWTVVFTTVVGGGRGRLAGSVSASRQWRRLHIAAYAGWALSIGHSLLAGTDAWMPWMLGLQSGGVAAVLVAFALRLTSHARYRRTSLTVARAHLATSTANAAHVSRGRR